MNDLMQALQSGLITPAQYQMMMRQMEAGGIGIDTPSARDMVLDMVMNSPSISEDMKNDLERRGLDTPQERGMLQGLLGGGQQMGPATVEPEWQPPKYEVPPPSPVDPMRGQQMAPMPQAPEPTMPMMPMPSADPSQMQMSPMPQIGAPTQNETDFLGQFVDNAKKAMYR